MNNSNNSLNTIEINTSYIIFKLQEKLYGINIKDIIEVINIPEIEISTITPKCVIGVFNYKGLIIKVLDICPLLGFETQNFEISDKLIIINNNGNCFAIHTKEITNIMPVENQYLQPLPFYNDGSLIKQIYSKDNFNINILDINKIDEITSQKNIEDNKINYIELFAHDDKSVRILKLRNESNLEHNSSFVFSFDSFTNNNQYIVFTLKDINYCIDLKYVKEFISIKHLNITKIPYSADYIKGLINIKGDFLVVIDLKRFLNDDISIIEEGSKLIIIEGENFNIAFLVDDIKYIKNIKDVKPNTFVSENCNKYIYSEIMEDDVMFHILNVEKILNDDKIYININ